MNKTKKSISDLQAENFQMFLKDGPRLRYDYNTFIIARDDEARMVLIGGLGGAGVGQMWFGLEDRHKDYPGFEDAPQVKYCKEKWEVKQRRYLW